MLEGLVRAGHCIVPIMSENAFYTDTRFSLAEEFSFKVEELVGRKIIHTVVDAEPLGPKEPLDALIVAPCTGNTLAKATLGITDTAATMAIKAHLRADRPTLIALATNDAISSNLGNIGNMLKRKSVYFLPMKQDSPKGKPHSLVAEFELMETGIDAMMRGEQLRPLFLY
jgi:dipicolinate synthase subunit B